MSTHSREPGQDPEKTDWLKQFSGLPGDETAGKLTIPPAATAPKPEPEPEPVVEEAAAEKVEVEPAVEDAAENEPASKMSSSHRMLYFQLIVLPLVAVAAIVLYEVSK